jgi:propionyl-CoA synthetase
VFGGFSSAELGNRIIDSKPKVIISASGAIENNKILSYQFIVQEALE